MNELLLIVSVLLIFGSVLVAYMFFGRAGIYCVSALATVFANVEVVILIKAFGMEQTLGNVLFAATFLATDILSECESKASANKAVYIGIFSTLFFLALSQLWMLFDPSEADASMPAVNQLFSQTPRLVVASLAVYAVSQFFDVWLYHKWWSFTERKFGDKKKYLWLRNNGSTLVSQLINTLLFTTLAFAGTYDFMTLLSIFGSGYVIFVFTSLLDTPVIYLARKVKEYKIKSGGSLLVK
ncbi:MAG: queuosine precursor transporter [Clostridiales bacterium]|nr:queuosine precursor transporter [Clostridiales bacterium]